MIPDFRKESRSQHLQIEKVKPTEQSISEINEMIISIPTLNDESQLKVIESIIFFIFHFDYDIFRTLLPEKISLLLNLTVYQPNNPKSLIPSQSINLLTIFLRKDPTLIDEFVQINLIQMIFTNMINTPDLYYQISCVAFLYELLKIKNELRDQYLSLDLPNFIITNCSPFPDKVYFEFLTLVSLMPSYLPDLSLCVIQSFIAQKVTQERTITVLRCLILFIRTDQTLIIPIISSNFLESIVSSLGRVTYTIAKFLKFSSIALQINDPIILESFLKINIFEILQSSLELVEQKEISFSDMYFSSIRADNSPKNGIVTVKDKLLRYSCILMNILLQFDSCLLGLEFVSGFNFANCLEKGLPFKITADVIRFLLNYSIKMPISIAKKLLNEQIIKNSFYIASLYVSPEDDFVDSNNEFVFALSLISSKFSSDKEITNFIKSANEEYDNVIVE